MVDGSNEASPDAGPRLTRAGLSRGEGRAGSPDSVGLSFEAPTGPFPTVDGYEIISELGRGGMGVVYKAKQLKLNRLVALKMVRGFAGWDDRLRFLHESEMVCELQHTHIVHLYEVGTAGEAPFFSMEYLDGGTMSKFAGKAQPPREAAKLVEQIARAIHFAHQRGIVHRDLKPANVLFAADGCPKVTDFGVAKRMDDQMALTQSGALMGTPYYMAPEQARGSKTIGPAADVYSLGTILYELLTGRTPFIEGESELHICQRILTEDPVSPAFTHPGLPREIEAICLKCLRKDPAHRYASAADLADDLARYLADEPIKARPIGRITRTIKYVRRHPWRVGIVAALIAAVWISGYRLWRWEAYEREHIEFYGIASHAAWGELQGLDPLTDEQVSHRYQSYRFHRLGRYGHVVACDVVNGHGVVMGNDVVFAHELQGAGLDSKLSNTACRIQYNWNADGLLAEEVGYDKYGRGVFRLQYDYQKGPGDPRRLVTGRYATTDGYELASPFGASFVQFRRNELGREEQLTFVDRNGRPTANADGIYGLRYGYGSDGSWQATNIDQNGQPMESIGGAARMAFTVDAAGRVTKYAIFGLDDQPRAMRSGGLRGIASIVPTYDGYGNRTSRAYFDEFGKPSDALGWAKEVVAFSERGDQIEFTYFGKNGEPVHSVEQPARTHIDVVDARGNPLEVSRFNAAGKCVARNILTYNAFDDFLEWRTLDGDGKTLVSREVRTYDDRGRLSKQSFFDGNQKPKEQEDGYTTIESIYGQNGIEVEHIYAGYTASHGFAKYRTRSDVRGRIVEEAYLDEKGELAMGPDGYAVEKTTYDDRNNPVERRYLDRFGSPGHLTGYQKVTNVFDARGVRRESTYTGYNGDDGYVALRRILDETGKTAEESTLDADGKLVNSRRDGSARTTFHYDASGRCIEQRFFEASGQIPGGSAGEDSRGPAKLSRVTWENETTQVGWVWDGQKHVRRYQRLLDDKKRPLAKTWLDPDGMPMIGDDGVVVTTYKYDDFGREIEHAYWDAEKHPMRPTSGPAEGSQRVRTLFNEAGRKIGRIYDGYDPAGGYTTLVAHLDERGLEAELIHQDEHGSPAPASDGTVRTLQKFDERRRLVEQQFFGKDGQPVSGPETAGRYVATFWPNNAVKTRTFSGYDGTTGYYAARRTFDSQGNLELVEFLDASGQPALSNLGYARKTLTFNKDGERTGATFADAAGKPLAFEVVILQTTPAGLADKLGLKAGDVIVQYDGHAIRSTEELAYYQVEDGDRGVEIVIRRNSQRLRIAGRAGALAESAEFDLHPASGTATPANTATTKEGNP